MVRWDVGLNKKRIAYFHFNKANEGKLHTNKFLYSCYGKVKTYTYITAKTVVK